MSEKIDFSDTGTVVFGNMEEDTIGVVADIANTLKNLRIIIETWLDGLCSNLFDAKASSDRTYGKCRD